MLKHKNITFQEALDTIESLPEGQQENLINILQHRLIERRREFLAKNISKARKEYDKGKVKKGTVEDLMKEITE